MTTPRRRRRLWSAVWIGLVVVALLLPASAAMAQGSFNFHLGCWATTTAGGATRVHASANFRSAYAVTHFGSTVTQASANYRLRPNLFVTRALVIAPGPTPPPPPGAQRVYLPRIFGEGFLQRLVC